MCTGTQTAVGKKGCQTVRKKILNEQEGKGGPRPGGSAVRGTFSSIQEGRPNDGAHRREERKNPQSNRKEGSSLIKGGGEIKSRKGCRRQGYD